MESSADEDPQGPIAGPVRSRLAIAGPRRDLADRERELHVPWRHQRARTHARHGGDGRDQGAAARAQRRAPRVRGPEGHAMHYALTRYERIDGRLLLEVEVTDDAGATLRKEHRLRQLARE